MSTANVRQISVSLGADVTSFVQGMNDAKRTLSGVSTDLRGQFAKINAQADVMVERLKLSGKESQIAGVKIGALSQKLQLQSGYVRRLSTELDAAKTKYGATSKEVQKLELQLLRAQKVQAQMGNELKSLKAPNISGGGNLTSSLSGIGGNLGSLMALGTKAGALGVAITGAVGALQGLAAGFKAAANAGISFNATVETSRIALENMLGSSKAADVLTKQLVKFAAKTPFEFPELMASTKKLLAFGFEADKVLSILQKVGDASAGLDIGQDGIDRVIKQLGQIRIKGKVGNEELQALADNNINAYEYLAKAFGKKDNMEIFKMAEKNLIPAGKGIEAIINGMGKAYAGMMDKLSGSWSGMTSTIRDNFNMAMGTAFKPLFEFVRDNFFPAIINGINATIPYIKFFANMVVAAKELIKPALKIIADSFKGVENGAKNLGTSISPMQKFARVVAFVFGGIVGMASGVMASMVKLGKTVYNISNGIINTFMAVGLSAKMEFKKSADAADNAAKFLKYGIADSMDAVKVLFTAPLDGAKKYGDQIDKAFSELKNTAKGGADDLNGVYAKYKADTVGALKETPSTIKDASKESENALSNFIDKVKSKTEQYRDALSLFEKATVEKFSGERLLVRLQSQLKVLDTWKSTMVELKNKLGQQSGLFQYLQNLGPAAAGQAKALSNLSDLRLKEYESLYNRKQDIAVNMAVASAGDIRQSAGNQKQVVININGGVVTQNVDELVKIITRQLQLNGV